jgi:hypothetical protein
MSHTPHGRLIVHDQDTGSFPYVREGHIRPIVWGSLEARSQPRVRAS